jgi:predicted permease
MQLLIECLVFTSLGTLIGIGGAVLCLRAIVAAVPDVSPITNVLTIDTRFVAITVILGLVTGALFALAPMLTVGRRATAHVLREGVTTSARMSWTRGGLVASQVAMALVLLTATSAALAVVARLSRVDVGFDNDHAAVFEVTLPSTKYQKVPAMIRVAKALDEAVGAIPGVTAAGLSNLAPASHALAAGARFLREDDDLRGPVPPSQIGFLVSATPGYFRALGIRVLAGRTFLPNEDETSSEAVVMSDRAARGLFGSPAGAVGQRLRVVRSNSSQPLYDVIGVVSDVRMRSVSGSPETQIYLPYALEPSYSGVALAVSSAGDPAALAPMVQRAIATVDPDLPVYNPLLVRDLRGRYLAKERLTLEMTGAFGLITLGLCGIGLYGSLAHLVAQRTMEIGIRLALGAEPRRLLRGVVSQGLGIAFIGVIAGALLSTAAVHAIAHLVPSLDAPSVRAIVVDAGVLIAISVCAAWLPARRAARVDPLTALRSL